MIFLTLGQALNGANPLLDVFFQRDGFLVDANSLAFQIWKVPGAGEPKQVFPVTPGERQVVNVGITYPTANAGRLSKGRYFATWTVPSSNIQAAHEIRWFYKLAASDDERIFAVPFEVLTCPLFAPRGLCSIAQVRAEGVAVSAASDFRVHQSIVLATRFIERVCKRWFYPAARSFTLSSSGAPLLFLPAPIAGIDSVKVAYDGAFSTAEGLDPSGFRVYARHVSEGLEYGEDDRANPKLERIHNFDRTWRGAALEHWPVGERHIQVNGAFGYTDPDGATCGKTPDMIRMACMKMAAIQSVKKAGGSASSSASSGQASGGIKRLRTKDREVEFSDAGASIASGVISGDADVDGILELYMAPPDVGLW